MSYRAGLIHRCTILAHDVASQTKMGSEKIKLDTIATDVRCRFVPYNSPRAGEMYELEKRSSVITYKVLFGPRTRLDNTNKLQWTDPVTGTVRTFAVQTTYDPHHQLRHFVAMCEEEVT